jgi:hypothetical protein
MRLIKGARWPNRSRGWGPEHRCLGRFRSHSLSGSSDDVALVQIAGIVYGGTGIRRTVTVIPEAGSDVFEVALGWP